MTVRCDPFDDRRSRQHLLFVRQGALGGVSQRTLPAAAYILQTFSVFGRNFAMVCRRPVLRLNLRCHPARLSSQQRLIQWQAKILTNVFFSSQRL